MNLLADRSVHLVVTSPPYWQLKDYGTENQIGFHESYESYINNLNLVWNECERAALQSPQRAERTLSHDHRRVEHLVFRPLELCRGKTGGTPCHVPRRASAPAH